MKMPSEHLTKDRWEYWLRLPGWSHYEAAQLFFRIDPDHPNAAHNVKSANNQGFYFPVGKLFDHFRRCGLSRYNDDGALVSDRLPPKEWVKAFLLLPDVELPFVLPDDSAHQAEGDKTGATGKLALLNQAATRFWGNADRDDKGTHPKNVDVADWLVDKGFSHSMAKSGASIIRPDWAPTGRKPEE